MQSKVVLGPASAGTGSPRRKRGRVAIFAALSGSAIVALTAATALPRHHENVSNVAAAKPSAMPRRAIASQHFPARPSHTDQADVSSRRFTGVVGENLTNSLRAAGVPELQGKQYVAVLSRAFGLANSLSVDDRFDLVVERGREGDLGQLLYVGLDRVARADVELLKWTDGKSTIWVNADGVGGEDSSRMGLPVNGRLTSSFGERFHPILGYVRFHKGVDLAASTGTPIVAAAEGRVISAGWHGGYGQEVQIVHAGGLETSYGHMSRIAAQIGKVVRKGEVIGFVGSTGLSTGPHVHFEVTRNGRPVNPMSVKLGAGPGQLQGAKLRAFQTELRGLLLSDAN